MTNVPSPEFTALGFIAPPEPEVLAGVQDDWNTAFGGNLNPGLTTPQGQLASTQAAIIGEKNTTFVYFTNQVDPAYATGRMQDAIANIYFLERLPAQPTTVTATVTGLAGTVIPEGALAQDDAGYLYTLTDAITIPAGGTTTGEFANTATGPIPCSTGTLTTIYQAIPGWDTITNLADGVLGRDVETRGAFEERRAASVAGNSRGMIQSIQGAVLSVENVLDCFAYQNDTNAPVTYRGVTIPANAIYVAAVGGDNNDVAEAIWSKKSPGCSYYAGNTSVVVYDTSDGYSDPYPSYTVEFERPAESSIQFYVNLVDSTQVPSDAVTQVQDAIIAAFAGDDGGTRPTIGSTIYASRFYTPVAALGAWAQIVEITIAYLETADASFTASFSGTTMTVSAVSSGTLAAGQIVLGNGAATGTVIVSQSSGTPGGAGDYVVSVSQTDTSGTRDAYALVNSLSINIDEVPVTSAADIAVVLT